MLPAMNLPGMILRLEKSPDFAAIRTVEKAAFPGPAEAQLVDDLRNAGDSVLSLVAIENATVIGHAMLSKLKAPFPALALGPVAVLPGRQRMGVGTQLIRSGIAHSKAAGWGAVFVLGNPAYYGRFGFNAGDASGFTSPYAGLHFMVLALARGGLPMLRGRVEYAAAFAKLG
jgi:putative acetyltransferase